MKIKRGVIAVLHRSGTYLLVRRAPHLTSGGCWCFPGGHLEPGENARRAIQRELLEELTIEAAPTHRLGAVRLPQRGYILAVWGARIVRGPIRPNPDEITDFRWLTADQIRTIEPGLPSNEDVLKLVKRQ